MPNEKPWDGRFQESTDAFVEAFTASVHFDQRLYLYDIQGSIAHARMLGQIGVLTTKELEAILEGLRIVKAEIEAKTFPWSIALEDVHMNIEARLIKHIGEAGKKLHTGRSRNDQVATDVRLFLRNEIDIIDNELVRLQKGLLDLAAREAATIMPGFTHLQVAQPVTFGHHLMAWFEMLRRDRQRLADCRTRVNVMPLGAAALAGTSYPIDRSYTAELLGFQSIAQNSLDAVSDRDFLLEFIAFASIVMVHLSRFSEELILWTSAQFDFIDLPDRFCTGSSIMPQKKNPDVPELVRGKTGRITGHLMSMLMLMKGQPLAYNKDNQEDKEPLFDTIDNIKGCLKVYADMIPTLQSKPEKMRQAALQGFSTATDLADYLVAQKGVPFRDAHAIVGRAVRVAIDANVDLADLTLEQLQQLCSAIDQDVFQVLTLEGSVSSRNHLGGTAPNQVQMAIQQAKSQLGMVTK